MFGQTYRASQSSPYAKDIVYLGPISDEDRAKYYSLASVFVYPSFFEGFGLPVLEAMSCGAAVITSDRSSLPEVAGDAALLVDPYNISALASAMESVLTSPELADSLRRKALVQSAKFDWRNSVTETRQVIHRELSSN